MGNWELTRKLCQQNLSTVLLQIIVQRTWVAYLSVQVSRNRKTSGNQWKPKFFWTNELIFFAFDGILLPKSTFTVNQHYYLLISKIAVSESLHVTEPTHILRNGHCQTRTKSPKIFKNGIVNSDGFHKCKHKRTFSLHVFTENDNNNLDLFWIESSNLRSPSFVERNLIYQLIIRSTLFHFPLHRQFQQQFATI